MADWKSWGPGEGNAGTWIWWLGLGLVAKDQQQFGGGAEGVAFNFMYPLDWAAGCPDIWPHVILGVSLRVFLVRLAFRLVAWQMASLMWWASSNLLKT